MFARVITAQAEPAGFEQFVQSVREQLSGFEQPGFRGFSLLTDAATGKVMTISLWDTVEHLRAVEARGAGVTRQIAAAVTVTASPAEIFEVAAQA